MQGYKRSKLYSHGVKKYFNEIDVVNMLKTIRLAKVVFRTTLKQKHRVLMQLQRKEVISSDSDASLDNDFR